MADNATGSAAPSTAAPAQTETSSQDNINQSADPTQVEAQIDSNPNLSTKQKVEAKKTLKKLKLKIDGQEYDEELPFEIPDDAKSRDYMTKQLQMSKVAQKRMGEKTQLEGEVTKFMEALKKNPRQVLSDPRWGVDLKKLAAEMIEEEIANSQKSPEQLELEKTQRELQALKEEREQERTKAQQQEFERIQEKAYVNYENDMISALSTSDLPQSPYVVKKMADYMMLGVKSGMDITAADVLPLVREEILNDISQMAKSMPIETLEQLFGGDILAKIRKKNIAKAKSAGNAPEGVKGGVKDVGATKTEKAKEEPKKLNYKEFFKF